MPGDQQGTEERVCSALCPVCWVWSFQKTSSCPWQCSEDDPRAGDWWQQLAGVRARDFGSRCPLFSRFSSSDTWGLFLSTWLYQQHCQISYTTALGSQQHKSGNFQALLRLEAGIGSATFLLRPLAKASHRSSPDSRGRDCRGAGGAHQSSATTEPVRLLFIHLLQPHRPPCSSSSMPYTPAPQGLCTCCFPSPGMPFPKYPTGSCPLFSLSLNATLVQRPFLTHLLRTCILHLSPSSLPHSIFVLA